MPRAARLPAPLGEADALDAVPPSERRAVRPDRLPIAIDGWVEALKSRYDRRITAQVSIPAKPGKYSEFPPELDPGLRLALERRGVTRLYSHQAEAWDAIRDGRDVVVVTPTASGKTLCYNLPVLDAARSARAKALYLFPTKALAQDQVAEINELNRAGDLGVRAYTFDGDTPGDARKAVRTRGDIVVTNPDMLHSAILPHHTKWTKLFESLEYVVVDELHMCRGVFGSHVANVLRRLRRICQFYGSNPTFILCSATIANPDELAAALVGCRGTAPPAATMSPGARRWVFATKPPWRA